MTRTAPTTRTRVRCRVLPAAASRATAALLLGLHVGSRALVHTAAAGATRALAVPCVAAPTALTRAAASMADTEARGHEGHAGQCREENQTVHGKNPLHGFTESNTPRREVRPWESQRGYQPIDGLMPEDGATSLRWPIQSRHTPYRIRTGRIGTASDAATCSRLAPSTREVSREARSSVETCPSRSTTGDSHLGAESGWPCRASSWQWHGGAADSVGQAAQHSVLSPVQHPRSQSPLHASGTACATNVAHATISHTDRCTLRSTENPSLSQSTAAGSRWFDDRPPPHRIVVSRARFAMAMEGTAWACCRWRPPGTPS